MVRKNRILILGSLWLLSCSTPPSKQQLLSDLTQKFSHLGDFRDLQCLVRIQLAEPLRASWSENLEKDGFRAISEIDGLELTWKASPKACRLMGFRGAAQRSSAFIQPLVQQVDRALCVWLQSFYVESPINLQALPSEKWERSDDQWRLPGRDGRYLMISAQGEQVKAVMGPGQELGAGYALISDHWLPERIQYRGPSTFGEISDLKYLPPQEGVVFPESFWLRIGESEKDSRAVAKVQFSMCKMRKPVIQESTR